MSEEDLELLITTDDPGEDTLGEDNFHHDATEKNHARRRTTSERRLLLIVSLLDKTGVNDAWVFAVGYAERVLVRHCLKSHFILTGLQPGARAAR